MDGMENNKVAINKGRVSTCDMFLRFSAMLLTLVSAIVNVLNKQTKVVPIKLLTNLPPINISVTAKWQYQSAFVYHMTANVIACSYAAVSLLVLMGNKGGKKGLVLMISVLDVLIVALLFSSNGAAAAVGLLGYTGNSHVQWQKVCNVFGKFCGQGAASLALSSFASLAFLLIVTFAISGAHRIPN